MTVYKYFIKLALKQKLIILGYTTIFLLLSLLTNPTNTDNADIQFTETKLDIGIVDNMDSELSRSFINYLKEKNNIIKIKEDKDHIKEQIFLQTIDGAIIIPDDFDEKVVNKKEAVTLYKDDRRIGSFYIEQQIQKYLVLANGTYEDGKFDLLGLEKALKEKTNIIIGHGSQISENKSINTWFKNYYNYTGYMIMAVYVSIIGLIMLDFKNEKIRNRNEISSKRFLDFNKEIYLGQISIGVIITFIFIISSIILQRRYIGEVNFSKYVINIIVFSFSILCFTFLISNLTSNRLIVNGISTVVSLGTAFISGIMVPQELLSEKVLNIAKFFPSYYFVKINEINMRSLYDIKYEISMQLMFGIAFLLMGLYLSKVRQKV